MKIVICASVDFTPQIKETAERLEALGHEVSGIPFYSLKIMRGEVDLEAYKRTKEKEGDISFRRNAGVSTIRRYYGLIRDADAILVLNLEKKGIAGYIGANAFLEMGFAFALEKKIFLLHPAPDMMHKDEIGEMDPVVLEGDLAKIQ